jgi:hypothetical protein
MKMKNLLKTALVLMLIIGMTSCDKDGTDSNNGNISIRMVETIDSTRTLQLYCLTKKIYPCINYSIDFNCEVHSNNIDITFNGVIETNFCFTAVGPASSVINLGSLKDGVYTLNLFNGNIMHTSELTVSSDKYKIHFPNNSEFEFINTTLNRIPEHTIWGYVGYHKQETSLLVMSFINSLMDLGAKKKLYAPGHYSEFEIGADGNIIQQGEDSGYYFAQSFIFDYSEVINDVEQLVKWYAQHYGTEYLYISVYTDKNDKLLSWMY